MKGVVSAQKALQGSEIQTRELLEERERIGFPRQGVIDLPSKQINNFLQKGNRKESELVARPAVVHAIDASLTAMAVAVVQVLAVGDAVSSVAGLG